MAYDYYRFPFLRYPLGELTAHGEPTDSPMHPLSSILFNGGEGKGEEEINK
jgi:hypothetical protein